MLLLIRKKGDQVLINDGQIIIKVICLDGKRVALGIQAAKHANVDGKEIYLSKKFSLQEKQK